MLTMLPNKVAIEPIFDPDTIGSIIVPEQAKERCKQGLVKYVGSAVTTVQVGDHVMFGGYDGTLMQLEDEGLLLIMPEEFIKAVVYDDPIEIPGLYFRDVEGNYFNATHEQALHIIANGMRGHTSIRSTTVRSSSTQGAPSISDYDRLR